MRTPACLPVCRQHSKYSDVGTRRGLKTAAHQGAQGLHAYVYAYQGRVYGGHTKAISPHAFGRQMLVDAHPGSAEAKLISTPNATRTDVTTSCASAVSSSEQAGFVVDGRVALKPRSLVFDSATDHSARRFTCCSVEATVDERVRQERHGLPDDADEGCCARSNSDSSHLEPGAQAGLCVAGLDPIATQDNSSSTRSPMHQRSAAGSQMGASLDTLSRAPTGPSGRFESPNTLVKPNSIETSFVATHTPTSPVQKNEPDETENAELPGKQWSETMKNAFSAVGDDAIHTCGNQKSQLDAESGMKSDRLAKSETDTWRIQSTTAPTVYHIPGTQHFDLRYQYEVGKED